jgi:Zn-dependent M16 (insulinase) family peptidase
MHLTAALRPQVILGSDSVTFEEKPMRSTSLTRRALLFAAAAMLAAHLSPGRVSAAAAPSGERPVKNAAPAKTKDIDLGKLDKGATVEGFTLEALYLDDRDVPVGARFTHKKTGFIVDLLRIESVPQTFTWVNTFPVSDQGEPHTQEHLLLGKGTKGRAFAGLDTMWLAVSSAFTEQLQTCYHFNTAAGADVFFDLFSAQIDALLHPNYSDEEIRREVCNFGVADGPDHTQRLEEKGSVYNEMVSSTTNPYWKLFQSAGHLAYGTSHPVSYNAGGEPSGIRTMKPEDIRSFHKANYYLSNMGTIAAFPSSITFRSALARFGAILDKNEAGGTRRPRVTENDLPAPRPAAAGTIRITEYPYKNADQPSPIMLTWPANRSLDTNETLLADLFVSAVAGDPTTNLYKLFIDSKTRTIDVGAKSVFGSVSRHQGNIVQVGFTDVDSENLTEEKIGAVRKAVVDEIARVAAYADGSPELREFNERISSRLVQTERDLAKFVNSPPGFGGRNTGAAWMDSLFLLDRSHEFRRSLTFRSSLAFARSLLETKKNFWKGYLEKWKVLGVVPYATAAKPSPDLLAREDKERTARGQAEAERLAKSYGVAGPQEAIQRYQKSYDAESARIEEEASKIPQASFVKSPPMTLDDQLQYDVGKVGPGVPIVTSHFDSMTSASVGLALRLDPLTRDQLRYVSLLPPLLTQVGVIDNGTPVSFEEMSERLRKEILSLDAGFSSNMRTNRVELLVHGAGLGEAEAARAVDWMSLVLLHPDWRPENLPRIKDLVDQILTGLRNTMQGPQEYWVTDPSNAYRMQTNLAYLAAESALTAEHNALRLRWLLKEAPPQHAEALAAFLTRLAAAGKDATREDLKALAGARADAPDEKLPDGMKPYADRLREMPPAARAVANDALEDLDLSLIEIPDASLAADWKYLCEAMRDDLATPPAKALADLDAVRKRLLSSGGARTFLVGSSAMEKSLEPKIAALVGSLDKSPLPAASLSKDPWIDARLMGRGAASSDPVYVGLLAPNMTGGVIMTSAPGAGFSDAADRDKQLDYLASRLYAGYGAHGIFLKTIGAGLAYSNGLRASVSSARIGYYAERTPELPQTVKFVIDILKNGKRDSKLGAYSVAQVFAEFRSAASYEARAEGMAADLADGQTPEQVRRFRESILKISKEPRLGDLLFDRKDKVLGRVLPGYNIKGADVPGAVYYVIGPDKQLDAWEAYLKTAEGGDTKLYRLYPRDYWLP